MTFAVWYVLRLFCSPCWQILEYGLTPATATATATTVAAAAATIVTAIAAVAAFEMPRILPEHRRCLAGRPRDERDSHCRTV